MCRNDDDDCFEGDALTACEVCGELAGSHHYGAPICSDACRWELMDAMAEDMAVIDTAGKVRPGPNWTLFLEGGWADDAPVYDDSIPY